MMAKKIDKKIHKLSECDHGYMFHMKHRISLVLKKFSNIIGGFEKMAKKWIASAIKKPGALHKKLGVPEGKTIPAKKLAKAAKSRNPTTRKQVALAKTLKGMHK